jgi:hypothetical protein
MPLMPPQKSKMSLTTPYAEQYLVKPSPGGGEPASDPPDDLGPAGALAGSSTLEATLGYDQVRKVLYYGNETSSPWNFHPTCAQFEAWLALIQMGIEPNFLPYEVSTTEFTIVISSAH